MAAFFSQFFETAEIERILSQPDVTLEQVLEASECFQECLSGNHALLSFLSEKKQIEAMLDLMLTPLDEKVPYLEENPPVEESDQDQQNSAVGTIDSYAIAGGVGAGASAVQTHALSPDQQRRARLAYAASEVFASDAIAIIERITSDPSLLMKIFGVFRSPKPLAESSAYLTKVLSALLRNGGFAIRIPAWFCKVKMSGEFDIVSCLFKHISVTSVQQCLLTLCTLNEDYVPGDAMAEEGGNFISWAIENGFMTELRKCITEKFSDDPQQDESHKIGALWLIVGLLSLDSQNAYILVSIRVLTKWLASADESEEPPFINEVISLLIDTCRTNPQSAIVSISSDILQRVVRAYTTTCDDIPYMTPALSGLLKRSEEFKELLLTPPPNAQPLELQTNTVPVPFGLMRLKILEILRSISLVNLPEVYSWFFEEGVLKVMMDLVEQYEYNNLVHSLVIGSIRSCFQASAEVDDLIREAGVPSWVCRLYLKGKEECLAYTGYLYELIKVMQMEDARVFLSEEECEKLEPYLEEELEKRKEHGSCPVADGVVTDDDIYDPHSLQQDEGDEVINLQIPVAPPPTNSGNTFHQWDNPITDPEDDTADCEGWAGEGEESQAIPDFNSDAINNQLEMPLSPIQFSVEGEVPVVGGSPQQNVITADAAPPLMAPPAPTPTASPPSVPRPVVTSVTTTSHAPSPAQQPQTTSEVGNLVNDSIANLVGDLDLSGRSVSSSSSKSENVRTLAQLKQEASTTPTQQLAQPEIDNSWFNCAPKDQQGPGVTAPPSGGQSLSSASPSGWVDVTVPQQQQQQQQQQQPPTASNQQNWETF